MDYEAFGAIALIIGGAIPVLLLVFLIIHIFVKSQRKENARTLDSIGKVFMTVMCIFAFIAYIVITKQA